MNRGIPFLFAFLLFSYCVHPQIPKQQAPAYRWPTMGTFFEIKWIEKNIDEGVSIKLFEVVKKVDEKVSTYKSNSDLSLLNQNAGSKEWVVVDELTIDLLKKSLSYKEESSDAFNIAVGPLVRLWKLDMPFHQEVSNLPAQKQIDEYKNIVEHTQYEIQDHQVRIEPVGARLDMGAIAKGYALDLAHSVAEIHHLPCGLITLGRQVMLIGSCCSAQKIGVQSPFDNNKILASIELSKGSISTSGAYERFIEHHGKRYGHIISPKNGYPIDHHLASVTVWAESATDADAWSTILYVLGYEEGLKILEKNKKNIGVLWVKENGQFFFRNSSFGKAQIN